VTIRCSIMKILPITLLLFVSSVLFSQNGYEIKVEIRNYEQDTLFLGFYYGDKQYLKDTAVLQKGRFVFKKEEPLKPGAYLLILRPDNAFVQIHVNEGRQMMDIRFDAADPVNTIAVPGDKDNTAFYEYIRYLNEKRPLADQKRKETEKEGLTADEKSRLEEELRQMNEEVRQYQERLIRDNPGTLTAMTIATFLERSMPNFESIEDQKERQVSQYRYFMEHYFDGLDFNDPRLIRTNFAFNKISDYINKHTIQIPDSINKALDHVMKKMEANEDAYKFFLVHFVNHFAKSNIIGMDAVYVHLVDSYYAKGAAPWVDEEQLEKMRKNAESLRPILIGKIAPDIRMERRDGSKIALHEMRSPYTVLIFWAPDCGHCQKTMPKVIEFNEKYRGMGVEIFSVCTKLTDKVPDCWKMIDEKGMDVFLNVVDPYHQSRFSVLYDVRTTPQVFILDEKKEILLKRIAIEQLDEVMEDLMDRRRRIAEELK
jgi:thiol-disulfide isomerase/thioredoxin